MTPDWDSSFQGDQSSPRWDDPYFGIGQMLIMGWDGAEVTPDIRDLIENHHLGSIILGSKNLNSASHATGLIRELQAIAYHADHPQPLLIAIDQENGGVNGLYDEDFVCQFPSAMGLAASGRTQLAYEVSKATATAVGACGVNLLLGPVLDVLANARCQPLGVRTFGDDPLEVSQYGIAAINGIKDAGLATCGKHFPAYGGIELLGSPLDTPLISQSVEELNKTAFPPYRNAISTGKLDCVFVGGCALVNSSMNIPHACLSGEVVDGLLRDELGFEGVVISECLQMGALKHNIGLQNGAVMAVEAGCDLIQVCQGYKTQLELIEGLKLGFEDGILSMQRIQESRRRIHELKAKCTSWEKALNPTGISLLKKMRPSDMHLSDLAYDTSITVVRDEKRVIPLNASMSTDEDLLLLTPLINSISASNNQKPQQEGKSNSPLSTNISHGQIHGEDPSVSGEDSFRKLGQALARTRRGKLLHTSYTENGLRPTHESLIHQASTIIIVTADPNINKYQASYAKHVSLICSISRKEGTKKSLVVVAISSPYDFVMDHSIETYVCTFDFSNKALQTLARVLCGESQATGKLPGTFRDKMSPVKPKGNWIVEEYRRERDGVGVERLIQAVVLDDNSENEDLLPLKATTASLFQSSNPDFNESHFVVRNSSTNAIWGFVATYILGSTGIISILLVDPSKQSQSVGRSLHRKAIRHFKNSKVSQIQLGLSFPGTIPGIPCGNTTLKRWFNSQGWNVATSQLLTGLVINNLASWTVEDSLLQTIQFGGVGFALILAHDTTNVEAVMLHVQKHARPEITELYRQAFADTIGCNIIRARDARNCILGTVVACRPGSKISIYLPGIVSSGSFVGGIIAPVVPSAPQSILTLQGLVYLGIKHNKAHKAEKTIINWVSSETCDHLLPMGLKVGHEYEELIVNPSFLKSE